MPLLLAVLGVIKQLVLHAHRAIHQGALQREIAVHVIVQKMKMKCQKNYQRATEV